MSDSKEDKPVLGRKPLGIKRTVESGQVQQQFSHGRKNTVVVEVKRRRVLGKPGETAGAAPATAPQPDPTPAQRPAAPAPQQRAPQPAAPARPAAPQSLMSRQELQAKLLREAEEARMAALEDARRREDAQRLAASEDEKRRAEENRRAAEEAERQAAEDAAAKAAAPATAPVEDPVATEAPAPAGTAAPATAGDDRPAPRRFTPVTPTRRPEPAKPARDKKGADDRRSGKLTVTKALNEDDGARARSLAALKRAREKEHRRTDRKSVV
jgi:translation initiation factor IF-2